MTNKEKIYELLKELSKELKNSSKKGITASEVAEVLNMKRTAVSHYLNELHEEGILEKINTRPVYFVYKEKEQTKNVQLTENTKSKEKVVMAKGADPFANLIGFNGSLKMQVEQCKVAASYPGKGLPLILTGESGVGKSYMAQLIYEYAQQNEYIDKEAPFVIFNCAEYANNPELLSAKLFGHKKGAFTGAESDVPGIIEEANEGYLFLDEVHRLSPEGQEKLFLILDKGIYRRLGESGKWRKANLRFIFATTENPEKILLETFLRRIPLQITIPSLSDRPIKERMFFIYKFYKDEVEKINLDVEVSKQVLNVLLSVKLNGNIGKLMNIIKYSCAHAYTESLNSKGKKVVIHLSNLPQGILIDSYNNCRNKYNFNTMKISLSEKDFMDEEFGNNNCIEQLIIDLANVTEEFNKNNRNLDELSSKVNVNINKIIDEVVFNKEKYDIQGIPSNIMTNLVEEGLKILENNYGIKYYGNTSNVLSKCLNYFWQNIYDGSKKDKKLLLRVEEILKKEMNKYYNIANKLLNLIEVNIDYKFDERVIIYLVYYLFNLNSKNESMINAIIIAHGHSTASSIASVANKLVGDFIFEAFDMPIEVSTRDIIEKINSYLDTVNTTKGLIILVDMGSLEEIYKPIVDKMQGDIAIVNNITTQIALDVGLKIKQSHSIRDIVENVDSWKQINYKYIKYNDKKKFAILSTCISGIGTAVKIRDLLNQCINDENIEVVAYDFNRLKDNGTEDKIFKEYNVILIVGTSKLNISEIPYICIDDLIMGKGENVFNNVLKNKLKNTTIETVNENIIKMFSLQNLLNQLTILNPNKIIDQVEKTISHMEIGLGKKFINNLKTSLYVHISCLIERLIVKDYIDALDGHENFKKNHKEFMDLINKAFEEICRTYKVQIPIGEIQIIYQIINNSY